MKREAKTIALALATVFMYAFGIWTQKGGFIFPFPLNEAIVLICAVYFSLYHFKANKFLCLGFVVTAFFHLLASDFYWEIFLNQQQMEWFVTSWIKEVFKLFYYIGLIVSVLLTMLVSENKLLRIGSCIPVGVILFMLFVPVVWGELLVFFLLFLFSLYKIDQFPLRYLWILLFVLELTKVWSLVS